MLFTWMPCQSVTKKNYFRLIENITKKKLLSIDIKLINYDFIAIDTLPLPITHSVGDQKQSDCLITRHK